MSTEILTPAQVALDHEAHAELLMKAARAGADGPMSTAEICHAAGKLPPVLCTRVLQTVKMTTSIDMATLRSEARAGGGGEPDHLAFARGTLDSIGASNLIFADESFWQWTGCVWKKRKIKAVQKQAQATISTQGYSVTAAKVASVANVLANEIYEPDHTFNLGARDTINCANGELVMVNGAWTITPHSREHYRTTLIPVAYDPSATAPLFWWFIHDVFALDQDRDAKVRCVLELIGYTLMSHADHEKFAMLIGKGANGKSVLLHVIEQLVGSENVAAVQPSQFDNKWQRAHLHMKLANIVTELPEGDIIADAELKAITSGELTTVETKGCDPFDMRAFATCWFGTNHMPHTRDFSDALFRRATILTFNRTWAEHEQDKTLKHRLAAELPGILNYALWAYGDALAHGFTAPPSSETAKLEWKREADQVRQFVEECCVADALGRVQLAELYRQFRNWASSSGVKSAVTKNKMSKRLEAIGYTKEQSDGIWIVGLRHVPTFD